MEHGRTWICHLASECGNFCQNGRGRWLLNWCTATTMPISSIQAQIHVVPCSKFQKRGTFVFRSLNSVAGARRPEPKKGRSLIEAPLSVSPVSSICSLFSSGNSKALADRQHARSAFQIHRIQLQDYIREACAKQGCRIISY